MSHNELFVSQTNYLSGIQRPFEKAEYVIFGVPFDVTSTYRTGARFGPNAIRQASLNIETYSFRTGLDVENIPLHDLGDLHISTDTKKTLNQIADVVRDIVQAGKTAVVLGGEHTITFGIVNGLNEKASKTAIVSFDAHLDLRNEYSGLSLSHTTFMRRINEKVRPGRIIEVGTRAVCSEELAYARKSGIAFLTTYDIRRKGVKQTGEQLRKLLADFERIYLSIDMDILDPAYVPAVQNPEPEGIEPYKLLDIIQAIIDERVIGFDILEIAPNYDQGISAIQAAKIIFEILCFLEKRHKK